MRRLLLLLLTLAACESSPERSVTPPGPRPDGGAPSDAAAMDAAALADAEATDSGLPLEDGGEPTDGGAPADSGASGDAGVSPSGPSAGCGMSGLPTGVTMGSLTAGGMTRSYTLVVPADYDPNTPLPLVFGWHGSGSSGDRFRRGLGEVVEGRFRAIYVYPDGLFTQTTGSTGWVLSSTGRDVVFFDALYADLVARACVQLDRVLMWGFSFGGYMTNLVGCVRGAQIRGFVEFSGGMPVRGCATPVGAVLNHGRNDDLVPFSEGQAARDAWRTANGCAATSHAIQPSPCVEFDGCQRRTVWCDQPGLGHDFPQMSPAFLTGFLQAF